MKKVIMRQFTSQISLSIVDSVMILSIFVLKVNWLTLYNQKKNIKQLKKKNY